MNEKEIIEAKVKVFLVEWKTFFEFMGYVFLGGNLHFRTESISKNLHISVNKDGGWNKIRAYGGEIKESDATYLRTCKE